MKHSLIIIILVFSKFIVGQTMTSQVDYVFTINEEVQVNCSLYFQHENQFSTFINYGFDAIPDSTHTSSHQINGNSNINIQKYKGSHQQPEYQKFFKIDSLFSYETIYKEKFPYIVSEKLPFFDWNIEKETKELLGYNTQKATTNFRGRNYTVWFAPDIQISDGPFKFHGLPGLILEVVSEDGRFKFNAVKLALYVPINSEFLSLRNKYPDSNFISIKEKLKIIAINEKKEVKYQLSKNPNLTDFKVSNSGIEMDFSDVK